MQNHALQGSAGGLKKEKEVWVLERDRLSKEIMTLEQRNKDLSAQLATAYSQHRADTTFQHHGEKSTTRMDESLASPLVEKDANQSVLNSTAYNSSAMLATPAPKVSGWERGPPPETPEIHPEDWRQAIQLVCVLHSSTCPVFL